MEDLYTQNSMSSEFNEDILPTSLLNLDDIRNISPSKKTFDITQIKKFIKNEINP